MEPMMLLDLGTRKRSFGAKRCGCSGAAEYWRKRDERIALENELREEYERRMKIDRLFTLSLLPSRWKDRTFEAFDVTPENEVAYLAVKRYADRFSGQTTDGLMLSGEVGRGKTHLCAATTMELMSRNHSVVFGTVTTLLAQIRSTFSEEKESEKAVFNRLTKCQLLVIDDLGKEKVSGGRDSSEVSWVEQTLYEIINTRYETNRPILITTNMDILHLPRKYPNNGKAILSRLLEMCRGVQVDGPDWRMRWMQDD